MSIASGTLLGSYEITHVLGAGGMGEVYRARDSKLGRSVAIKVILDAFGTDPDRVARFQREAKVLASINHPNIAALYGMEEWNGQHFLVMELVEGETLAERLQRGPLPVEEALRSSLQIVEALEAAHDRGIVHRDLKPANIKITPDDRVKVLDFGLAKAMDTAPVRDVANSPTLSMMATNAGIILGTAAYMSPEQAKGFAADHRSDVFSFGVILYEMLTGRQPFQGETAPDVLASVLVREPELHRLPSDLNPRIPELLRRCLEKSPKRRWQAIGDLRAEIEAAVSSPRATASQLLPAAPPKALWRRALPVALTSLLTGLIAAFVAWQLKPAPPRDIARFAFVLSDGHPVTGVNRRVLDISPDGRQLVYVADAKLYVRPISSLVSTAVQGTENQQAVFSPVFSPDSQHVAFYAADGTLKRTAISGGAAVNVCQISQSPFWITWARDNILFTVPDGVMRVPAMIGGTPEKLISNGPDERIQRVQMLPGEETILFTIVPSAGITDRWENAQVVAQSLKSGARKTLIKGASDGWYLPTGHLAYVSSGTLHAVQFDLARLEAKGAAVPIVEGVRRSSLENSGVAWFSVSTTGTLVYIPGPPSLTSTQFDVVIVDQKGNVAPLKLPPAPYEHPRVSPDGNRIVVATNDGKEAGVLVYDLTRSAALQPLTFGGKNRFPIWTSDSRRVAFQSDRHGDLGIFWQAADGTSDAERLTTAAADESHVPESWQPRGDLMLFSVVKGGVYTLWTYSVRDRKSLQFGDIRSSIPIDALFSPDGKWVAYSSTSQSGLTIYVQPFPPTRAKYELLRAGRGSPHHPLWSHDGKALIFNAQAGSLDVISVMTAPTFAFGTAVRGPRRFNTGPPDVRRAYDTMPDGRLVGLVRPGDPESASGSGQVNVVLNWFDELRARVSGR